MVKRKPTKFGALPALSCKPAEKLIHADFDLDAIDRGYDPKDIRYIFVSPPKYLVGTTVSDSVYFKLLDYPGGISKFYEDAVISFDGDLDALVEAAAQFGIERKRARQETHIIWNANGRVSKAVFDRIQELLKALATCRGISRSKVISGLMQLKLTKSG